MTLNLYPGVDGERIAVGLRWQRMFGERCDVSGRRIIEIDNHIIPLPGDDWTEVEADRGLVIRLRTRGR